MLKHPNSLENSNSLSFKSFSLLFPFFLSQNDSWQDRWGEKNHLLVLLPHSSFALLRSSSRDSAGTASQANRSAFPCNGKHPPTLPNKQHVLLVSDHCSATPGSIRYLHAPTPQHTPHHPSSRPFPWLTEGPPSSPPSFRSLCHNYLIAFPCNTAQCCCELQRMRTKCKRQATIWLNVKWLSADCILRINNHFEKTPNNPKLENSPCY